MFNYLGSIFGYGGQQAVKAQSEEAKAQTQQLEEQLKQTEMACRATQTLDNASTGGVQAENIHTTSPTTQNTADWVIIDRSEEAEKCNKNSPALIDATTSTSMMASQIQQNGQVAVRQNALTESSTGVMLGSFFDKNSAEDDEYNRKYKSSSSAASEVAAVSTVSNGDEVDMMQATAARDWLITPLPCLTSITASQRSIESDPLENLLIEHPSMSVFVAATSSSSASDDSFAEDEDSKMNVDDSNALKVIEKNVCLAKSVSEKRKVAASPTPSAANSSASQVESTSPSASLKRKGKKSKKPSSTVASSASSSATSVAGNAASAPKANKENTQHQQKYHQLCADDFKKQTNAARLESLLLNKNQMKRANKNSVFAGPGAKNANVKNRKYHKLQQPACFVSNKPVF